MRKQIVTILVSIVAAALIAVAMLTIGGCTKNSSGAATTNGAAEPGAASSAAPASAFAPYGSAKYRFAIRYPKGWQGATSTAPAGDTSGAPATSTTWADPKGKQVAGKYLDALAISVYELTKPATAADVKKHAADFKAIAYGLIKDLPGFTITDPLRPITLNGSKGFQVTYTYTVQGAPAGAMSYLIPKGRFAYWLTGQASRDTWGSAWSMLTPAMASFTVRPLSSD